MKRTSRIRATVIAVAVTILVQAWSLTANAEFLRTFGHYTFHMTTGQQLNLYNNLTGGFYLGKSAKIFDTAYDILSPQTWRGSQIKNQYQIQVYFFTDSGSTTGYAVTGTKNIYLNNKTLANVGSVMGTMAHETSHIIFGDATKAGLWAGVTPTAHYYFSFLTESLAYYTEAVFSGNGYANPNTIKSNLMYCWSKTGVRMTFKDTAYNYDKWDSLTLHMKAQVQQQFRAQGWFLTNGNTKGSTGLSSFISAMGRLTSNYSSILSSNYGPFYGLKQAVVANLLGHFEESFKVRFGYYSNWDGVRCSNLKDKNYALGQFYYIWYNNQ